MHHYLPTFLRSLPSRWAAALAFALCASPSAFATPLVLHTNGSQILDSNNNVIRFRGVNVPSLEWSNVGEPNGSGMTIVTSVNKAVGWGANLIRLPICQDRWLGYAGQTDGGAAYQATVDSVVNAASASGKYVLIDMHWSDMGTWGSNLAQHMMPDDNTTTAWTSIATHYKNNPAVLFDAYNEPHDINWSTWLSGGTISETFNGSNYNYHSPGMQGLYNTIRATGANNIIAIGGINWAFDISGVANGYAISGSNLMYSSHIYPGGAFYPDFTNYDKYVGVASSVAPVFIGEFGAYSNQNPSVWLQSIMGWIDQHGYSGTAWTFHPAAGPQLITDFTTYAPTTFFGTYVQAWLGFNLESGIYTLAPQNAAGSRLYALNSGTSNGNACQIWSASGSNNQSWIFSNQGSGWFKILPAYDTALCLDAGQWGGSNNAPLWLWSDNGNNYQRWNVNPAYSNSSSTFKLVPKSNTGLEMTVQNGNTGNGSTVQINPDSGASSQKWAFTALESDNGTYRLSPQNDTTADLDVANWGTSNGTVVDIWTQNNGTLGTTNQQWVFIPVAAGVYKLVSNFTTQPTAMCLNVNNGGNTSGTLVNFWSDTGTTAQQWTITQNSNGTFKIRPQCAPTLVLGVPGGSTTNGTQLEILTDNGSNYEQWTLH